MTTFEVLHPGMYTTVQDLGRHGYQKFGLSVQGSVDDYAHRLANILVSNAQNDAVLEITMTGLKLKVLRTTVIAITGADLRPTINDRSIQTWASYKVQRGDIIHFTGLKTGCRAYLAVAGGIDVPLVHGSRSTDTLAGIGGYEGRALMKGDLLQTGLEKQGERILPRTRRLHPNLIPTYPKHTEIRVILGPQANAFTDQGLRTFLSSPYKVTKDIDRMGLRLEGERIEHRLGADILTEGIVEGAIQVPKNGQPIVFLSGRRGIGGYTKIASVIRVDIPKLAQVLPGYTLIFRQVALEEAHEWFRKREKLFTRLERIR